MDPVAAIAEMLKFAIDQISAAVRSLISGDAARRPAVLSTADRTSAEFAAFTREPSTTKCSSDLLRPGGLMHIGLYSEAGRGDVSAAREFIAAEGFGTTPAEIRRCRQRLLETRFASVARFTDFFTTSECRDLLFHVRETRVRIPAIAAFIAEHGLRFLGFEFAMPILQRYRNHFASSGWSLTDLARWHAFESEHPETFSGMYQFWVQRP